MRSCKLHTSGCAAPRAGRFAISGAKPCHEREPRHCIGANVPHMAHSRRRKDWPKTRWFRSSFLSGMSRHHQHGRPAVLETAPKPCGQSVRADAASLLVFAKAPIPGQVKTRLAPVLGMHGAARLHAAMIERTLATGREFTAGTIELWCAPDATDPFLLQCAARFGVVLREQQGRDIGERMYDAFQHSLSHSPAAILIGSDIPTLTPADLLEASDGLNGGADACIAPALDGGYVLLGLRRVEPELFRGICWGSADVFEQTRERLRSARYRWQELRMHRDIDRPDDWAWLLDHCPEWGDRVHDR